MTDLHRLRVLEESLTPEDTARYLRLNCPAHSPIIESLIASAEREAKGRELLRKALEWLKAAQEWNDLDSIVLDPDSQPIEETREGLDSLVKETAKHLEHPE